MSEQETKLEIVGMSFEHDYPVWDFIYMLEDIVANLRKLQHKHDVDMPYPIELGFQNETETSIVNLKIYR